MRRSLLVEGEAWGTRLPARFALRLLPLVARIARPLAMSATARVEAERILGFARVGVKLAVSRVDKARATH